MKIIDKEVKNCNNVRANKQLCMLIRVVDVTFYYLSINDRDLTEIIKNDNNVSMQVLIIKLVIIILHYYI